MLGGDEEAVGLGGDAGLHAIGVARGFDGVVELAGEETQAVLAVEALHQAVVVGDKENGGAGAHEAAQGELGDH